MSVDSGQIGLRRLLSTAWIWKKTQHEQLSLIMNHNDKLQVEMQKVFVIE